MKQYCLPRKHYLFIFLLVLIIHLLLIIILFVAPSYETLHQEVMLSYDDQTYHASKLLSGGKTTATAIFEHERPEAENSSDLSDSDDTSDLATPILDTPRMPTQKTASTMAVKEKDASPARPPEAPTKHKPERASSRSTQGPTLADISRGFLKSVKQHAGHNTAAHNPKELALQVYASKVWNNIKQSFLIGENRLRLPASVSVHAQMNITIDRSGKLVDIKLVYPQHITEVQSIEQLLIARAYEVGLFPPFGPQMAGQTQRFSFPLVIQGQEGFHSYSLGYR